MDITKITNNPDLNFKSLEDEIFRVYEFTDGSKIRIDGPVALDVSKSGGHRILDTKGISHYIPSGWVHPYWKVQEGKLPFAF
jgi:hypothetical protein